MELLTVMFEIFMFSVVCEDTTLFIQYFCVYKDTSKTFLERLYFWQRSSQNITKWLAPLMITNYKPKDFKMKELTNCWFRTFCILLNFSFHLFNSFGQYYAIILLLTRIGPFNKYRVLSRIGTFKLKKNKDVCLRCICIQNNI